MTDPERRPVAIAVAPNGGRRTKADHPALPLTPVELARTAAECRDAGAAMIHAHIRDRDGAHWLDADAYHAATAAIRAEVGDDLVLQITSESLGRYRPGEQMAVMRAVRPEAVSLALRELAPDPAAEPEFAEFLSWLKRERVMPQIILYTPEEAARLAEMHRRGLVPWDGIPVLFVLGRYVAGQTSLPPDLLPFLAPDSPRFRSWMVCAFGPQEAACALAAALLGGDVRVGFENNLHRPDGSLAGSNADLVRAVAEPLIGIGGSLADAAALRAAWGG